jgi:hypothetical protein
MPRGRATCVDRFLQDLEGSRLDPRQDEQVFDQREQALGVPGDDLEEFLLTVLHPLGVLVQ